MKKIIQALNLFAILLVSSSANAQIPGYTAENVSPLRFELQPKERVIEPTSVVLGNKLSNQIRKDPRHPEVILAAIKDEYTGYRRDLLTTIAAYADVVNEATVKYCNADKKTDVGPLRIVEHAAIPLNIIEPLIPQFQNVATWLQTYLGAETLTDENLELVAKQMSRQLLKEKQQCGKIKLVKALIPWAKLACTGSMLIKRCSEFADVNQRVFSMESGFPRVQFGINGFTSYVYGELLKTKDLDVLLKTMYDATNEWFELIKTKKNVPRYDFFVSMKMTGAGFSGREALVALAYAYRNMPSIDIQYAEDLDKALMLEVYFWKFKDLRTQLLKNLPKVFAAGDVDDNPGIYHVFTASLQACELTRAGFPAELAIYSAVLQKVAYKGQKLVGGIDFKLLMKDGVAHMKSVAKNQGFTASIQGGEAGGSLGIWSFCTKENTRVAR